MAVKIGINGFGRIGRQVCKAIFQHHRDELTVVAINDLMPAGTNAHMLKYDSTYGRYPGEVEARDRDIYVDGDRILSCAERDPANLPWRELGVDIVLECTGLFRDRESAAKHLAAGAGKVIISAPGKGVDATFVLGVNEEDYDPGAHHVISNASCTTNCVAPVAKVLHQAFGIERALMSTIHAVTNGQKILDMAAKDLRRARTAGSNIIPTTTGAARAVGMVLPELNGRINGMAFRVPVVTGSVVDLTASLREQVTIDEVNTAFKEAASGRGWLGRILDYTDDPVVSTDFIGYPASSIVDGLATDVMDGDMVKVVAWYDNEWAYSMRLSDLAAFVAEKL